MIAVPLMLEDQPLGDVTVELALDTILTVSPVSLADALGNTINSATQEALRALGDSLVPIDQVKALGLDLQLNPQTLTVTIRLAIPARGTQTFTASSDPQYSGMARISPSHYAFGLTAALLANSDLSSTAITNASTGLSGFLNIGGERGFNLVGSGTLGISGLSKNFQRDRVIAFVDGQVGIGRDTGQGFVMVARHKSLKNAQIKVTEGAAGRTLGFANHFGPAVIPIDNSYRPVLLRMNGINLPEGYDIGSGDYVALPGARSGILIEVGSDAFHSVIATLQSRDGKPLSLISGRLRSEKTGKISSFFTNRTGRAVFTMLAPGRYGIEIDDLDETFFFDIADDSETLKNLATVRMGQGL